MRAVIALAVAVAVGTPAAAFACGNAVMLRGDKAVREVKRAEARLKAGKIDSDLLSYTSLHRFRDEGLRLRAARIEWTAQLRVARLRPATEHRKLADELVEYIDDERSARPDDPVAQALHAELLVLRGDLDEARTLIEDLAARDVVPDAPAWVVAATVRDRAGDAAGRDAALDRCKKTKATLRGLPCRVL